MYYAGYSESNRAYILTAESDDGLLWQKDSEPVISPDSNARNTLKCSEMCVICLPGRDEQAPRYRMVYEASDGTTEDQRGVWRIAIAISAD